MTLDLDRVDIRTAIAAAVEGVQDRLIKSNIKLELSAPRDIGSFVADERRIRQILFNLLSNAIGFSPPGGTVVLTAERARDQVSFTVKDHGPGIPNEIKDKVFDWFESHTDGTHHRGAGLGLSIVRSFVELQPRHGADRFRSRTRHHRGMRLPARGRSRAGCGRIGKTVGDDDARRQHSAGLRRSKPR